MNRTLDKGCEEKRESEREREDTRTACTTVSWILSFKLLAVCKIILSICRHIFILFFKTRVEVT